MKLELILLMLLFLNSSVSDIDQVNKNYDNDDDNVDTFSKCYDELGCIETDSRWYDKNLRPVNLKPVDRHIIKTDFLLIKSNASESPDLIYNNIIAKEDSIKSSGFNKKSDIFILIHDFSGNGYTGWVKHLSKVMFKKLPKINIISVDWQRGAEPPYDQAISNARVVALEIILLLKELKETFSISFTKVHIIGHGVGAHIAGYVGSTYNGIKKITGLDPSGPRFEGMPEVVKLNPSNAKYVEVIHTDAYDSRSQGTKEALGHSDFYINNALNQPGCPVNTTFSNLIDIERNSIGEGEILPGCSHKRAFKYFIESITSHDCKFMGIKCRSYEDFAKGNCTNCGESDIGCRTFGLKIYNSSIPRTTFFLNTASHTPFCMFQYRISVFMTTKETKNGYFDFILVDDKASVTKASLLDPISNDRDFSRGSNNTFIYYAYGPRLSIIKEAKVRWNEEKKFYCFIYCKQFINVGKIVIQFLGTGRNDGRRARSLCPTTNATEIENGTYRTFTICNRKNATGDKSKSAREE